jgi:2-methylcitrate dehydratase PrpD
MSDSPNAVRDPIESFLDLIENTRYKDLPEEAVAAATVFFMDTVGVACAGRLAPGLEALIQGSQAWVGQVGRGPHLWNSERASTEPVAALVNGYQCHALEYDCVYEPGVILPAAPIFAALMVRAQTLAQAGRAPSGADLIHAFTVAVEVSTTLGAATRSGMFFFRPSTTGTFAALAAIACLDPLPREQLRYAFGIAYSQMCGPMQAHEEGSMMLAMQMGFAARNAIQAHDMARMGLTAPVQLLAGRFGFFHNFEHGGDIEQALQEMAKPWKVTRLSHKPFPSGRVTHGVIHAMRQLRKSLAIGPDNALDKIRAIEVSLPPLGMRLVGRPMIHHPPANYARLCIPFVAAAEVFFGSVDPSTFTSAHLQHEGVEALARRVHTQQFEHPNPNAFYPQKIKIVLGDGSEMSQDIPHAWGHPDMPLTAEEREDKFRLCWRLKYPRDAAHEQQLEHTLAWLNRLPEQSDTAPLYELLASKA